MLVIACYSAGTSYASEAALLGASLSRAGMDAEIVSFPDQGGWYPNTAYKARFIRDMRHKLKGPLLYVDVDAFVHENCAAYFDSLGESGVDLGVHYFAGPAGGHDRSKVRPEGWRLLSGTLFLGDTIRARELTRMWCSINAVLRDGKCPQGGGQKNLWFVTTCMGDRLKIERLPGRYCYVFDKPWAYPAGEPIIIEHTIASRDNREIIRTTEARRLRKEQLSELLAG